MTNEQIVSDIESNPIMLYMKGSPEMPMCGFSNAVVQVLNHYGVEYKAVNVLEDPVIRERLSDHSGWPTIPQLYVKGEFVGGSDIMMEMWEAGELHQLVNGLPARAD